jgi:hypothetical protein
MANPADERAATGGGRGRLRASHAGREPVLEVLKVAFVQGRLTRNELDVRADQALAARTYAELAAVTADIPATPAILATPAAAGRTRPPTRARRRPLVKAAAGSGGSLVIAAAAMRVAFILDPGPPGPTPYHSWARQFVFLAIAAVLTAVGILVAGVAISLEQRRSRGQLPPPPGPDGHALEAEPSSGTGHGPALPPDRPGQTRADLRAHQPRQRTYTSIPAVDPA